MKQPRRIFLLLVGAMAALEGVLVWSGWPETNLVADDAFYYFTIARNLAHGLGPSFDTLAPTNGFHPLWQLLLVPLWWVWPHSLWIPVRAALSLTVLLDVASAAVIFDLVRRLRGERSALVAVAIWCFCPLTFFVGLRGMEASLSTLCILLTLRALVDADTSWRSAVRIGLWVGLCGWARTDNLLVVGLAVAVAALAAPRSSSSWPRRLGWTAATGGVAAAIVSPWFVWNLTRFGQLLQVSARIKGITDRIVGHLDWDFTTPVAAVDTVLQAICVPVQVSARWLGGEQFQPGNLHVAATLLFLALLVVYLRRQKGPGWSTLESRFAWSYLALHAWIFGLLWRSYATWYAMPWFAILLVVLTATRPRRAEVWSRPARLAAAVSALLLASFLGVAYTVRVDHGARGPERRFRPLLERARVVLPEGGNLGAFDAGAVGYVAGAYPGLRVVNLDCLVNNVAYAALRDGRYGDYVVRTVDLFLQRPRRARMFLDESDYEEMMREFREKVESREGSPSPN